MSGGALRSTHSLRRVTTFLDYLETWKCQGIRLTSTKSREEGPKSERSGNLSSQGNLIVAAQ